MKKQAHDRPRGEFNHGRDPTMGIQLRVDFGNAVRPEIEDLAEKTHRKVGSDPRKPMEPLALIDALLGPGRVKSIADLPVAGMATPIHGVMHIVVPEYEREEELRHTLLHELVHIHWDTWDELLCNYLGAALLVPRPAMRVVAGFPFASIAKRFRVTQAFAALRDAEVSGRPRVVLRSGSMFVRGAWPGPLNDPASLPGVRRTHLTDPKGGTVFDIPDALWKRMQAPAGPRKGRTRAKAGKS